MSSYEAFKKVLDNSWAESIAGGPSSAAVAVDADAASTAARTVRFPQTPYPATTGTTDAMAASPARASTSAAPPATADAGAPTPPTITSSADAEASAPTSPLLSACTPSKSRSESGTQS
jgi:hypothetical protein